MYVELVFLDKAYYPTFDSAKKQMNELGFKGYLDTTYYGSKEIWFMGLPAKDKTKYFIEHIPGMMFFLSPGEDPGPRIGHLTAQPLIQYDNPESQPNVARKKKK